MQYRFVDCRWSLDDPGLGRRLYLEAHIPGAVFLDVERDLSAPPGGKGRHPLPSAEQFAGAASRAGIAEGVFVVAYGALAGAERLWWLLRHFGHDDCAVLELEAWRGALRSGEERVEPAAFVPRERGGDTIGLDELAQRRDELVVVDARLPARWRGEENPVDRVPGRIPGALNAPWNAEPPALPAGELVAYCGSGITATALVHRLHLAGREAVLYPGSWSEWEQYPELPVERSTQVINRHAPSILLVSVTGLLFSYGSSAWSWVAGPVAALGLWGLGRKVREPAPAPKQARRRRSQLAPVDQEL